MMGLNLHALVRGAITAVHPDAPVTVLAPAGWTVDDNYRQHPVWRPAVETLAQSQPVPDKALQFLVQQRANSRWRDFYFYGCVEGLDRTTERGGAFVYWNGGEWQVDQVLEDFAEGAGWCKVRCILLRRCAPPEEGAMEPPASTCGEESEVRS